jgi:hypothetical protein
MIFTMRRSDGAECRTIGDTDSGPRLCSIIATVSCVVGALDGAALILALAVRLASGDILICSDRTVPAKRFAEVRALTLHIGSRQDGQSLTTRVSS